MSYSPRGSKESDRTEQLNNSIGGGGSCLKIPSAPFGSTYTKNAVPGPHPTLLYPTQG